MTNIIPMRAEPEYDDTDTDLNAASKEWALNAFAAVKDLGGRFQNYQQGYRPGTNVFDYRDRFYDDLVRWRREAADFTRVWTKCAESRGISQEVIEPIMRGAKGACDVIVAKIDEELSYKRPLTPEPRFTPPPPPKPVPLTSWKHPVMGPLGIVAVIVLVVMFFAGELKPYAWTGIHNGSLSHGFGLRTSHHRN